MSSERVPNNLTVFSQIRQCGKFTSKFPHNRVIFFGGFFQYFDWLAFQCCGGEVLHFYICMSGVTRSRATLAAFRYCGFEIPLGRKGEMTKEQLESFVAFVQARRRAPTQDSSRTGEPIVMDEETLEDSLEFRPCEQDLE